MEPIQWNSGEAGGVKKTYKKLYFSGGAGIPNWFGIPMVALVFSVDLVFKEELVQAKRHRFPSLGTRLANGLMD